MTVALAERKPLTLSIDAVAAYVPMPTVVTSVSSSAKVQTTGTSMSFASTCQRTLLDATSATVACPDDDEPPADWLAQETATVRSSGLTARPRPRPGNGTAPRHVVHIVVNARDAVS